MFKRSKKSIYLDSAATTFVDPKVLKAMEPFWSQEYANPSSIYSSGRKAHSAITGARESITTILNCRPNEIIFTGGGTESINTAIFGAAKQHKRRTGKTGHIITTRIEHHAILNSVAELETDGWKVDYAEVDSEGFVNMDSLKKLVRPDTVLVSVMYANNEIGTIQPIGEIGKWINGLNKVRTVQGLPRILFHTDACQAGGSLELNVHELHTDLLSLNASKIYGPKGIGLLYVKSGIKIIPLIFGGGQERNMRSGTENVPAIIGLAKALELAQANKEKENLRLLGLVSYVDDRLSKKVKGVKLNGPKLLSKKGLKNIKVATHLKRLPNNLNYTIKGIEGEALMIYMDAMNVQISTGSACETASEEPSHVLKAIGLNEKSARESIRITIGKTISQKDLDYAIDTLCESLNIMKKAKN